MPGQEKGFTSFNAVVDCDQIEFYGKFLKLLGMSEFDTGRMFIYGGANYNLFGDGVTKGPVMKGTASFGTDQKSVFVKISNGSLEKKDHVYSILLVSEKTGSPVSSKYIDATKVQSDDKGIVTVVTLSLEENDFTGRARVYYMVDTYPAAKGLVTVK
jgi:hypothetical protein